MTAPTPAARPGPVKSLAARLPRLSARAQASVVARLSRLSVRARLAAALVAALALICLAGLALPAQAGPTSSPVLSSDAVNQLPIVRWMQGTADFHSRQSFSITNFNTDWFGAKYRSTVVGMLFGLADWMWTLTFNLTVQAVSMDILSAVAAKIDALARSLSGALIGRGASLSLLGFVTALFLVWSARQAMRGGGGFVRLILPRLAAIALICLFATAPTSTRTGQTTVYGRGSASWYVSKVNQLSNAVLSPVMGASDVFGLTSPQAKKVKADDGLHCDAYVAGLRKAYIADQKAKGVDGRVAAIMSVMWEDSGMAIWKITQFGANDYADRVYCHLLDRQSDVEAAHAARAIYAGATAANPAYASHLPGYPTVIAGKATRAQVPRALLYSGMKAVDKATIGLAACQLKPDGTWKPAPALSIYGSDVSPDACKAIFEPAQSNDREFGNAFNWKGGTDQIEEKTSGPAARFLKTLQGGSIGNASMQGVTYLLTSTLVLIVFCSLAIGIIAAKFAMVAMAGFLPIILFASIAPGQDTTGKLAKTGKSFIGYGFISALAVLILSSVIFTSSLLQSILVPWFGRGSIMATFVIGASPALAFWLMHKLFKKLGIPSPLTVQGALDWGASAGGLGRGILTGGIAGGVGGGIAGRLQSRAVSKAAAAVKNRLPALPGQEYRPRTHTRSRFAAPPMRAIGSDRDLVERDARLTHAPGRQRELEAAARADLLAKAEQTGHARTTRQRLHPWQAAYTDSRAKARTAGKARTASIAWAATTATKQRLSHRARAALTALRDDPAGYAALSARRAAATTTRRAATTSATLVAAGILAGASPFLAAGTAGLYGARRLSARHTRDAQAIADAYRRHLQQENKNTDGTDGDETSPHTGTGQTNGQETGTGQQATQQAGGQTTAGQQETPPDGQHTDQQTGGQEPGPPPPPDDRQETGQESPAGSEGQTSPPPLPARKDEA